MKTQMFIKKNLFFFPLRLVFMAGPEVPKPEETVKNAEKILLKNPELYANVEEFSRYAKAQLEAERKKTLEPLQKEALKGGPEEVKKNAEAQVKINKAFEDAMKSFDTNQKRFEKVLAYAQRKAGLKENHGPLTKYEQPVTVTVSYSTMFNYRTVLSDQSNLLMFRDEALATGSDTVLDDLGDLHVDDRIKNTRVSIDTFYENEIKNANAKLTEVREEKDETKLQVKLDELYGAREHLEEHILLYGFPGATDPKKYHDPAKSMIYDINTLIVEKTIGNTKDGKALAKDIEGATSNLEQAHKGNDKKWEAGAQAKFDMLMAKTSAWATLQMLRRAAQGDKTLLVQFSEGKPEQLVVEARRLESTNFNQAKNNYTQLEDIYRAADSALFARNELTPLKADPRVQTRLVYGDNLFRAGKFDDAKSTYSGIVIQLEREKVPPTGVAAAPIGEVKKKGA